MRSRDLLNDQADSIDQFEARRSAALHSYDVLDAAREQDFDDIGEMAAKTCQTPIAVVNLVDTNRQFFMAEVGLGVRSTPIETAFCRHALLADDILVIPDATKDGRLSCNPLVTGEPHLRSYAGVLLKTPEGLPIGTVCVLDYKVREFTCDQIAMLRFLARQAMKQLELRKTVTTQQHLLKRAQTAEQHKANFESLVKQASEFIGMADAKGNVIFLNKAAKRMVGMPDNDRTRRHVLAYVQGADRERFLKDAMPLIRDGEVCDIEVNLRNFNGGQDVPVLLTMFPLRDDDGDLFGYGVVSRDLSDQKEEERRLAQVLGEATHRIKNTLAVVHAIVTQTLRSATSLEAGRETIAKRVTALAKAQDILNSAEGTVADIADVIESALEPHDAGLGRILYSGDGHPLSSKQALGLSLALHELATNAAKYGALSGDTGTVMIDWSVSPQGDFILQWVEQGGPTVSPPTTMGFGSKLIDRMVAPYFNGEAVVEYLSQGVRFRLQGKIPAAPE